LTQGKTSPEILAEDVGIDACCGLVLGGRAGLVVFARYDARAAQFKVERIPLDDPSLASSWGDHLNRIVLTPREATQRGMWTLTLSR